MSRGGGGSNTNNNSRGEDSAKIAAAVEDLQIQFESTTTTDAASSSSSELEQHHNYPKVILQADKLGRSAHAQILRILPKSKPLVSSTPEWKRLQRHAAESIQSLHLRDMLQDPERCHAMYAEHDGVYFDYSRQQATLETMDLLYDLAKKQELMPRIRGMFNGEKINFTEDRAVLHTALRASKEDKGTVFVDGLDAIAEVHEVLDQIKKFTEAFRSGQIT